MNDLKLAPPRPATAVKNLNLNASVIIINNLIYNKTTLRGAIFCRVRNYTFDTESTFY